MVHHELLAKVLAVTCRINLSRLSQLALFPSKTLRAGLALLRGNSPAIDRRSRVMCFTSRNRGEATILGVFKIEVEGTRREPRNFLFKRGTLRAGLEPATYGLEDRCSIQLSYRSQGWALYASDGIMPILS